FSSYLNFPKSRILQTGGSALGFTSTRSSPCSCAILRASSVDMTPSMPPSAPTTRTSGTRMRWLIRICGPRCCMRGSKRGRPIFILCAVASFGSCSWSLAKPRRRGLRKQSLRETGKRNRSELPLLSRSNRQCAGHRFFVADDRDVGVAHQSRISNLSSKLVRSQVRHDPQAFSPQIRGCLLGVLDLLLAHRDERHLLGREPNRESSGDVLDVNPEKPFERPEDRAVQHDRAMSLSVLAHEF